MQLGNTVKDADGIKAPEFDGTQACAKVENPDLFFPETPQELYHNTREAKKICFSCAFIEPCLEYALRTDSFGIWGGTTPAERKDIRRRRRLPPPASTARLIDSLLK